MDVEKVIDNVVARFIGTKHERDVKRIQPLVEAVNALEPEMKQLSDEELGARTLALKAEVQARLEGVEWDAPDYKQKLQEALEPAVVPAFATAREAGRRTLGMRHFDVQLIGGIVLHQGKIAEMKTGEGKTLVATLGAYLNSLTGKGVHIVTVNDYLARRDAEWMGPIFKMLGLTVGVIVHDLDDAQRRAAYAADITYGTNNEFGFDYLRDNMKYDLKDCVQRGHQFAIVDEVDSILIDEARTPLIISGPAEESTDKYYRIDKMIPKLIRDIDYTLDEKLRTATLTEEGVAKCERLLNLGNLYDPANMEIIHHVYQGLRAHTLFEKDVDYVVKDGEIVIVDEFTGRQMPGRRWSDGLHQAIEAKENVKIEAATQTYATITLQNYFRMYHKLAGMTGTAETEAAELWDIYKLDVVTIPTNVQAIRIDAQDLVYKTKREKYKAVIEEIDRLRTAGRPSLVGTTSVEVSELLSTMLQVKKIPHNVLNAKQHAREAQVVAEAGLPGAVTIATNMAGRGTDIKLGPGVKEAGGLAIIGTERHESRRVDRQLRGRSARQGDPGTTQFYVSLEDDLMRMFGSDRIASLMDRMGYKEGEVIQHAMVTKSIERAQKKVEENNFGIRKRLLEYDDVMNKQRNVVYKKRNHALFGERLQLDLDNAFYIVAEGLINSFREQDDYEGFKLSTIVNFGIDTKIEQEEFLKEDSNQLAEKLYQEATQNYEHKLDDLRKQALPVFSNIRATQGSHIENVVVPFTDGKKRTNVIANLQKTLNSEGRELMNAVERQITLAIIDETWKEHLRGMDDLKQSVQTAYLEQKDPLVIYKVEAFELFRRMDSDVNRDIISFLCHCGIHSGHHQSGIKEGREQRTDMSKLRVRKDEMAAAGAGPGAGGQAGGQGQMMGAGHIDASQKAGMPGGEYHDPSVPVKQEPVKVGPKIGRNDPCPCGSGKKYKQCHGREGA